MDEVEDLMGATAGQEKMPMRSAQDLYTSTSPSLEP